MRSFPSQITVLLSLWGRLVTNHQINFYCLIAIGAKLLSLIYSHCFIFPSTVYPFFNFNWETQYIFLSTFVFVLVLRKAICSSRDIKTKTVHLVFSSSYQVDHQVRWSIFSILSHTTYIPRTTMRKFPGVFCI